MNYEQFLNTIRSIILKRLSTEQEPNLKHILSHTVLYSDNLSKNAFHSSGICFKSYYEDFKKGIPISVISEQILLLLKAQASLVGAPLEHISEFEKIKSKIVYKLINTAEHAKLLSEVPFYPFLDLSVIFYLILEHPNHKLITALIDHNYLNIWHISKESLLLYAEHNTPLLFPPTIAPLEHVLSEIPDFSESSSELSKVPLYVLTNQTGINGSACLLYKQVLKNFADQEKDDLIILPSSIHEVLLLPKKKAFSYKELNEMVSFINHSEVPLSDRLSDHIYHYSRSQDCIDIPFPFSAQDEKMNPQ